MLAVRVFAEVVFGPQMLSRNTETRNIENVTPLKFFCQGLHQDLPFTMYQTNRVPKELSICFADWDGLKKATQDD